MHFYPSALLLLLPDTIRLKTAKNNNISFYTIIMISYLDEA